MLEGIGKDQGERRTKRERRNKLKEKNEELKQNIKVRYNRNLKIRLHSRENTRGRSQLIVQYINHLKPSTKLQRKKFGNISFSQG